MVKRPCSRQIKKAKNKKCQQKKQSEEFKRKATKKNRIEKSKRSGADHRALFVKNGRTPFKDRKQLPNQTSPSLVFFLGLLKSVK